MACQLRYIDRMECKYCGSEMRLDDKDSYIGKGGECVVRKYLYCDNCGASAYKELVSGKVEILEFYPPECT